MRVLLTGASGNLGAYLIRELWRRGVDIGVWSGSRKGEVLGIGLRPVELGDPKQVAEAFKAARPAIVLHAAAIASPAECFRAPSAPGKSMWTGPPRSRTLPPRLARAWSWCPPILCSTANKVGITKRTARIRSQSTARASLLRKK